MSDYHQIKMKCGAVVELTLADAYNGPDNRGGGMNVNTSEQWCRIDGGEWNKTSRLNRSSIKAIRYLESVTKKQHDSIQLDNAIVNYAEYLKEEYGQSDDEALENAMATGNSIIANKHPHFKG